MAQTASIFEGSRFWTAQLYRMRPAPQPAVGLAPEVIKIEPPGLASPKPHLRICRDTRYQHNFAWLLSSPATRSVSRSTSSPSRWTGSACIALVAEAVSSSPIFQPAGRERLGMTTQSVRPPMSA